MLGGIQVTNLWCSGMGMWGNSPYNFMEGSNRDIASNNVKYVCVYPNVSYPVVVLRWLHCLIAQVLLTVALFLLPNLHQNTVFCNKRQWQRR